MTEEMSLGSVKSLIQESFIEHKWVSDALSRIRRVYEGAWDGGDPRCLALIGESGAGKTRVLKYFTNKYHQERLPEGLVVPVLYLKVPSKPTVKGLATELLCALGDPLFDKGTETAKTIRLRWLLRGSKVRMLILDEFQHFVDQGSLKVQHHVADWLKILIEDTGVGLVVAGLPYCTTVIETNPQLKRRFQGAVSMPCFDWRQTEHRMEFHSLVEAFVDDLQSNGYEFPSIESESMAYRFFVATGGLTGRLSNLLVEVIVTARSNGQSIITMADLDQAARIASYDLPLSIESPFSRQFDTKPTTQLIERVMQVGTSDLLDVPESSQSAGKSGRLARKQNMSDVTRRN